MRALLESGNRLVWKEIAEASLKSGEVRIHNHATAVNRADLVQRDGRYAPPPGASGILGLECAGHVEAVARDVARFQPGDRVCALLAGGGYAELVTVPAEQVLPVPAGLTLEEAAALPEVFATAYLNIYMEAAASVGERVLLHAAASGVGTAGIQMCKAFGNPCFVTAGSEEKLSACLNLGADAGCNRRVGSFVEPVLNWSGGTGVSVILDPVGARYVDANLRVLALDGRLVSIGLLSGAKAEIDLASFMSRRLRLIGSTLRGRPVDQKARVLDELKRRVWPLIESGEIKPVIHEVLPIHEVERAHEIMRGNANVGKLVLRIR